MALVTGVVPSDPPASSDQTAKARRVSLVAGTRLSRSVTTSVRFNGAGAGRPGSWIRSTPAREPAIKIGGGRNGEDKPKPDIDFFWVRHPLPSPGQPKLSEGLRRGIRPRAVRITTIAVAIGNTTNGVRYPNASERAPITYGPTTSPRRC